MSHTHTHTHTLQNADQTIGIITYDFFHLKTEQIVHQLLRKGYRNIKLIALPYKQRPARNVLIAHRPNQEDAITTENLAASNNLEFLKYDGKSELTKCDFYLITGAGILPPNVVKGKKIINAHPGIIPSARGLDAFKWSIHDNIPLGVSLHYIDEEVDAGEIISIVRTPIYSGDSLATLARRHYELEIEILSNFILYLSKPSIDTYPTYNAHRRMPPEIEAEMVRRFDDYKNIYAKPFALGS